MGLYQKFQHKSEVIAFKAKTKLGQFFYKLGWFVGTYPIQVFIAAIVFSGLCAIGLINVRTESEPTKLWVSSKSEFANQKEYFENQFGAFYRLNIVIITPKEYGADVIQKPYLQIKLHISNQLRILEELWEMNDLIRSINVTDVDGSIIDYSTVCAHVFPDSPCLLQTVLDYWGDNLNSIKNDGDIHRTVSNPGAKTPYLSYIDPSTVMGLREYNAKLTNITKAAAFMNTYLLNNTVNANVDMTAKSKLWEKELISTLLEFNKTTQYMSIDFQAERSIADILDEKIAADSKYVVISYVLMLVYTVVALGRLDTVESKMVVGFLAVCLEILAIVIALGITSAGNVPLSPITLQVIPFLILGVGINDVFVFTAIFVQTPYDKEESPFIAQRKRLAESLKTIGPSMLLASSTNVTSFLVGAATIMPAIRDFCFQAAFSMAMAFILLLTLYSALLVLDGVRIQKNRFDIFCCFTRKKKATEPETMTQGEISVEKRDYLRYILVKYYLKFLSLKIVKIVVIVITIGLLAWGAYGAANINKGLGVTEVVPSESYVAHFYEKQADYFASLGAPVYFVMKTADYSNWDVQDQLESMQSQIQSNKWFTGSLVSWWASFKFWVSSFGGHANELQNGRIPPAKFYPWLQDFLKDLTLGKYFDYDVILDEAGEQILSSRMLIYSVGLNTTDDYISAIKAAQTITNDQASLFGFPYSLFYVYFEQYLLIGDEAIRGILTALAVIFVVSFLSIMHVGGAFVVVLIVGLIEIDYVGIMYWWDIDLNAISSVNLILGTGISVSVTTYTTLAFMESKAKTRQGRIDDAMAQVGISVLNGALSTVIGVFMLALAEYSIFRTYYFKMYISVVIFGIYYGLVVLPVLLSLIGPSYVKLSQNEVSLEELKTQYSEDEEEDKQLTVSDTADLQNL